MKPLETATKNIYFPRRWYVVLAVVTLMPLIAMVDGTKTVYAVSAYNGRQISRTHYGIHGYITGWNDPYAAEISSGSYEILMSTRGPSLAGLVEVASAERPECGNRVVVFWGWQSATGSAGWDCETGRTNLRISYSYEYDHANNRWCWNVDGIVRHCQGLQFGSQSDPARYLTAWATVTDTSVQLGGADSDLRVSIEDIRYKTTQSASWPAGWTYESSTGNAYVSCPTGCPYTYSYGFGPNSLFVRNWSANPPTKQYITGTVEVVDNSTLDRWQQWNYVHYAYNTAYAVRVRETSEYFKLTRLTAQGEWELGNHLESGSGLKFYDNSSGSVGSYVLGPQMSVGFTYNKRWLYGSTGDAIVKGNGSVLFDRTSTEPYYGDTNTRLLADVAMAFTGVCHDWVIGAFLSFYNSDNSNC